MTDRVHKCETWNSSLGYGMEVFHSVVDLELGFQDAKDALIRAFTDWAGQELRVELSTEVFATASNWEISLDSSQNKGFLSYQTWNNHEAGSIEIILETPFYLGFERNRFRLLSSANSSLEVTTTIESFDRTRPEFEIPRMTDSFLSILESTLENRLTSRGEQISPEPWLPTSDKASIEASPLEKTLIRSGVPIVILAREKFPDSWLSAFSRDLFGVAHVVGLTSELAPRGIEDFSIGVFWKDGSTYPSYFSGKVNSRSVYSQLVRSSIRQSDFEARWAALLASRRPNSAAMPLGDQRESFENDLTPQGIGYEDLRNKVGILEKELMATRRDAESYEIQWLEADEQIRELQAKLREQNFTRLANSSTQEGMASISLFIDLDKASIDSELNDLVAQTGGAVVFTQNVDRSWREARKVGYTAHKKMAQQLEKLCKLAMDYRSLNGSLGEALATYAKRKFDLNVITGDSGLEPKIFRFEDKDFNQEHHIKADQSSEGFDDLGRIHFALDPESQRLIISHMGKKLNKNKKS